MTDYTLKVKRLNNAAKLPEYAHEGDAGMDLFANDAVVIPSGGRAVIRVGVQIQLPSGMEAQIRPRSGLALNHGITVLNTPGTIDEGYRGEIGVILINHGSVPFAVTTGMKIAQMVVKPVLRVAVQEVGELDDTARGNSGFGSTGV